MKDNWKNETFLQNNAENGSAVIVADEKQALYYCIWIGVNKVSLMLSKEEIKSF